MTTMEQAKIPFGRKDGRFITFDAEDGYRAAHPLVQNAKDGSILLFIPGGEFEMGDGKDSDAPKHRVQMDGYYIGVYCVTNRQYGKFVEETKHRAPDNQRWKQEGLLDHPVVCVSWDDSAAYAAWAGCELPTEAQWEKAARGPLGLIYPWGKDWNEGLCRNDKNKGSEQTAAVWKYPTGASGYGSYQQSGNVWEWCRDWFDSGYYGKPESLRNPIGPATGSHRVNRGGSWRHDAPSLFRGARRLRCDPGYRSDDFGFRLARAAS